MSDLFNRAALRNMQRALDEAQAARDALAEVERAATCATHCTLQAGRSNLTIPWEPVLAYFRWASLQAEDKARAIGVDPA